MLELTLPSSFLFATFDVETIVGSSSFQQQAKMHNKMPSLQVVGYVSALSRACEVYFFFCRVHPLLAWERALYDEHRRDESTKQSEIENNQLYHTA